MAFSIDMSRCWSRALIWVSVKLCQVKGQLEAPPWLAPRGNLTDNSGQLFPTFYLSIDGHIKWLDYYDNFFVLFTVLMCSYSIFILLKSYRWQFFIFMQNVSFFFFHLPWIWAFKLGVLKIGIPTSNHL